LRPISVSWALREDDIIPDGRFAMEGPPGSRCAGPGPAVPGGWTDAGSGTHDPGWMDRGGAASSSGRGRPGGGASPGDGTLPGGGDRGPESLRGGGGPRPAGPAPGAHGSLPGGDRRAGRGQGPQIAAVRGPETGASIPVSKGHALPAAPGPDAGGPEDPRRAPVLRRRDRRPDAPGPGVDAGAGPLLLRLPDLLRGPRGPAAAPGSRGPGRAHEGPEHGIHGRGPDPIGGGGPGTGPPGLRRGGGRP